MGKVENVNGATMFFIAEKQQKIMLNFSLDSLIVTEWYDTGTSQNTKITEWSKWFYIGRTLSMINHMENMVKEMELSIIQKFWNLLFVITAMLTFQ